jgi:inositol-phosphate phosphatase/L-galactose 1-phosphate phosphatase/histidinol-phosphatase
MNSEDIENFCHALIKSDILPILQKNYTALYNNAREYGDDFFNAQGAAAAFKDDGKGLVSEGEVEAEHLFRQKFTNAFPNFKVYGEELGDENSGKDYTLVIDPVDGTSAMIASITDPETPRGFGITLGFMKDDEFIGGLIYELVPAKDTLKLGTIYSGWQGNERKDAAYAPFAALISTAPEVMFETASEQSAFHTLERAARTTVTQRNCMGFIDATRTTGACVIESDLSIHDIAALIPILQNAGLTVTDRNGQPIQFKGADEAYDIIAAAPQCHAQVLGLYQSALKADPIDIAPTSTLINKDSLNTRKFKTRSALS